MVDSGVELPVVTTPSVGNVDLAEGSGSFDTDIEVGSSFVESTIIPSEASEENRVEPPITALDDTNSNSGAIEDENNGTTPDERRRVVRAEVLAQIFPQRKEGESLRFDTASAKYVVETDTDTNSIGNDDGSQSAGSSHSQHPTEVRQVEAENLATREEAPSSTAPDAESDEQQASDDDDADPAAAKMICSICLEPIRQHGRSKVSAALAACSHVYHCDCLMAWAQREGQAGSDNCPTCRQPLWDPQVYKHLESKVRDRLGFDAEMMGEATIQDEDEVYEPEWALWMYVRRFLPVLCCLLVLLFVAQVLLPNVALSAKHWS